MEIWDAYYEDGTKANCELVRDELIPEELYHIVCEVLVNHVDGTYLLMQRDFSKKGFPGKFEASASGSALKGEDPIQGALRELKEETGITATSLKQIYNRVSKTQHSIYYGYLCITDCDKDSIILQEGETISYKWMNKNDFLDFVNSDEYVTSQRERLEVYLKKIKLEER